VQGYQTLFFLIQGLAVIATLRFRPHGGMKWIARAATLTFNLVVSVLFLCELESDSALLLAAIAVAAGGMGLGSIGLPAWVRHFIHTQSRAGKLLAASEGLSSRDVVPIC
jgi:hypothetical protein